MSEAREKARTLLAYATPGPWLSPATAARYLHLYGGRLEDMAKKLGGVR